MTRWHPCWHCFFTINSSFHLHQNISLIKAYQLIVYSEQWWLCNLSLEWIIYRKKVNFRCRRSNRKLCRSDLPMLTRSNRAFRNAVSGVPNQIALSYFNFHLILMKLHIKLLHIVMNHLPGRHMKRKSGTCIFWSKCVGYLHAVSLYRFKLPTSEFTLLAEIFHKHVSDWLNSYFPRSTNQLKITYFTHCESPFRSSRTHQWLWIGRLERFA